MFALAGEVKKPRKPVTRATGPNAIETSLAGSFGTHVDERSALVAWGNRNAREGLLIGL